MRLHCRVTVWQLRERGGVRGISLLSLSIFSASPRLRVEILSSFTRRVRPELIYRLGARPTVSDTMTLRPGSVLIRSFGLGAKGTASVGFVAADMPTMFWLLKRLLVEKPILDPLSHQDG